MTVGKQAVPETAGQPSGVQTPVQGQAVDLDKLPEFQKYKSLRDKKESEFQKALEAQAAETTRLQAQVEGLITDPVARQRLLAERQEAELNRFRTSDRASKARRLFAENWEVPESIFDLDDTPEVMTAKALDYQKAEIAKLRSGADSTAREKEQAEIEREGGHLVSKTPGTTPGSTSLDVNKQLADLQASKGVKGKPLLLA
jgi:succinate dehydrogenase/fumarate reductase flavoprotein subunit